MATSTRVSVEDYLSTDYSPDVEYLDGELVDRNVGEKDHSKLQMAIAGLPIHPPGAIRNPGLP
jgi:hypothetical protein